MAKKATKWSAIAHHNSEEFFYHKITVRLRNVGKDQRQSEIKGLFSTDPQQFHDLGT